MVDINTDNLVAAPVAHAFAYTANYRNIPDWLYGIQKFVPVGDLDYGLGAVFDGTMHVGATLHSRIEIDGFREGEFISFDTIKGFKIKSTWTFEEPAAGQTLIKAHINYELPGGIAGKALGKLIEPFVKIAVKHSSAAHKAGIEA